MLKKLVRSPPASCRLRLQRKSRRCLLFGKQLCIHDSPRHLIGLARHGPTESTPTQTERQPETQMGWLAGWLASRLAGEQAGGRAGGQPSVCPFASPPGQTDVRADVRTYATRASEVQRGDGMGWASGGDSLKHSFS